MSSKFNHETIYRGSDFIEKLTRHRLTICGAGALGSNLIDTLTRQGFPNIKVIDFDRVADSNINTQVYGEKDVGALKVLALRNRVFSNVGVELEIFDKELTLGNIKKVFKDSTLVIDCFDNTKSRQLVQDECRSRKIPCLHCGMGDGTYGEVVHDDRYKVPKDGGVDICDYPLARNLAVVVSCIAAEEILDFCLSEKPRHQSWSFTLKDLTIKSM